MIWLLLLILLFVMNGKHGQPHSRRVIERPLKPLSEDRMDEIREYLGIKRSR